MLKRKQWEERNEDALDCAYMDTTKEQHSDKKVFLDDKRDNYKAEQAELDILNAEGRY